jgi:electron transport complex protein RnfB
MLNAILVIVGLAGAFGLVLGVAAIRFRVESDPVVDQIDALLPQTQCGQCSYAGCRPYAEAIAAGEADINQCPPGGEATIMALADLLGRDPKPLNAEHGEHSEPLVAVIDEQTCIGCTLCIQACPVDAILGAAKQMHTVIEAECTGCKLCIEPCPVDCIDMVPVEGAIGDWRWPYPQGGYLPEAETNAEQPAAAAAPRA